MSEIVGLLLDDGMPPERLGALLRAARKRRGLTRKHAAATAGITAARLRAYERGDQAVPADVCALLAECYGNDLTAHVPLRVPPRIEDGRIAIAGETRPAGTEADVVAAYVDIVQRLRHAAPGEPIALRSADVAALAGALRADSDVIEARIAEIVGCSRAEAKRLHGELLRRKVILPVASLAAGVGIFAGTAYAAQSSPAANVPAPTNISATAAEPAKPVIHATPATAAPTTAPAPAEATTAPTTAAPPATTAAPTPAPAPVPSATTVDVGRRTDATVPQAEQQPDVPPVSVASPTPDPNDPPVSVLPGETPITIIGEPDSTSTP